MNIFGSLYCETSLLNMAGILREPIHALTGIVLVLIAAAAFVLIWRSNNNRHAWHLYALALLLGAAGVGGFLWHGFRTPEAFLFDVLPGLLFFFFFTFLWASALRDRWFGYAVVLTVIVAQLTLFRFFSAADSITPFVLSFMFIALVGCALLLYTYYLRHDLLGAGVLVLSLATLAVVSRSIDVALCSYLPFGMHFLSHILLATAAYSAISFLVRLTDGTTHSAYHG